MLLWIWLGCLVIAALLYFRQLYGFFKRQGVKTPLIVPPFGTILSIFIQRDHFTEEITKVYNRFSEQRFYGAFQFLKPFLMVRDIELIKKIGVKDYEHFLDHNSLFKEEHDKLFGRNLISLTGQEWKDMRSTLSPAFTSSKMKLMLPLMVEVGDQTIHLLKKKIKESEQDYLDIEVKDLTTRYANDVIASCAFGLKVDSQMDRDNQFYAMGKTVSAFTFRQLIISFLFYCFPKVCQIFKWTLFPKPVQNFFRTLVKETMQNRELKQIVRPDMIHLLMEAKKGKVTYDEKTNQDKDTGFATVEESSVGQNKISRGTSNRNSHDIS
ncbi:cytochrome P450 9e2-like [Hyposmocoma kahamanoa]|uniref:cytochrome P450 9e2-like n=1 Tax=Hyposmocoma kahamanoa TaxID=1477025 RepID=UPI000E6D5ED9|nr:cytochrome P450 9e2-like [Hyposmocoma kahamanoa]